MKKVVYACIICVVIIVAFVVGIIIGNGTNLKNGVVGVYQTDSWNGEIGTLALYEDGTCQYPSGGSATWESNEDTVLIKVERSYSIQGGATTGMRLFIDNEQIDEKLAVISGLSNVSGVYWNEELNTCEITLTEAENDGKTADELSKLGGVSIFEIISEKGVSVSEHEAKIMENGLVLHEHFFKKVSD